MSRTIRVVAALAAVSALGLGASVANAKPVHLSVNSSLSTIKLTISAVGGGLTAAATATVADDLPPAEAPYSTPFTTTYPLAGFGNNSGGLDAELVCIGTTPDAFQIAAGEVDLSDVALSLNLGFLGAVDAGGTGLGASLSSGIVLPTSAMPGMGTYDLGGAVLSLDQGMITYNGTGPLGGALGSGSFNFEGADAVDFPLPSGTLATVKTDVGGGVTVTIPINVTTTVLTDPIDVTAILNGQIVLTGIKVPEPGTLVLIGMGAVAMIPVIRRRRRSA